MAGGAYAASAGGRLSDVFWAALGEGRFLVVRCDACGHHRFPPTSMCPVCRSISYSWVPVNGRATLWTWTVVHRAPKPELEADVPYCLGVCELAEGPRVLARVATGEHAGTAPRIGAPLTLVIDRAVPGVQARYHFTVDAEG